MLNRSLARAAFTLCIWLCSAASALAATVTLAWDPSPDPEVAGYIVRYGTASRAYTLSFNAGLLTTADITGLQSGTRYYFAVQAYTAAGDYSIFSNEQTTIPYSAPARVIQPALGSVLTGGSATFQWNSGMDVEDFWLDVGTSRGASNLYSRYQGRAYSETVSNLPRYGGAVWVRLYSRIGGQWEPVDHEFTAASLVAPAAILTPTAGSRLPAGPVTFTWGGGAGVDGYWLDVGTARGAYDLSSAYQGTQQQSTVTGLPENGRAIWVRLYSRIDGQWQFIDYSYAAAAPAPAGLVNPALGSTVTKSIVLEWTRGSGVDDYWLDVGTAQGTYDLYSRYQGTSLTATLSGLPETGSAIWIRLYSRVSGQWQFLDYPFATTPAQAAYGRLVTPSAGGEASSPVQLTWLAGAAASDYWLDIGSSRGASDILSQYQGTATSATVAALPDTASTVWVRLYSRVAGAWQYIDYAFQGPR